MIDDMIPELNPWLATGERERWAEWWTVVVGVGEHATPAGAGQSMARPPCVVLFLPPLPLTVTRREA